MIQELTIDAQRGGENWFIAAHRTYTQTKNNNKLEGKQKGGTTELTQPPKLMQAQAHITNSTSSSGT